MTKSDVPPDPRRVPCAGPDCDRTVVPKEPKRTAGPGPNVGRRRRYCSQRCRQRAYRARHAPSRDMLIDAVTDGVQELRFLPRIDSGLEELTDADLAALATLVGQARAMHERIVNALRQAPPAAPAPAGPPEADASNQTLPNQEGAASRPAAAVPAPADPAVGAAPVRRPDGSYAPTAEQEAIIAAAAGGGHLVVEAGAGTGKTSTLVLAARAMPTRRGVYIAFNRAIAREAQAKMPDNVTASTAHSLAFRAVGRRYKDRLDGPRVPATQAAAHLGITKDLAFGRDGLRLSPAKQAALVMETVNRFCYSAARDITADHVPFVRGLSGTDAHHLARTLLPWARAAWEDLTAPFGRLKFGHDHYLKIWQLGTPSLNCDVVLFDEAQDANPVLVDVIRRQDAQQVIVGDSAQQLYAWRGAEDALATWPADRRLRLSQSWRFGPAIAAEANLWLEELGTDMRLSGNPAKNSRRHSLAGTPTRRTLLCRTNATAMGRAMEALSDNRTVALVGGTTPIRRLAEAARDLQAGRATSHHELMAFTSWQQVRQYVEEQPEEAGELATFVGLVDDHGPAEIIAATERMSAQEDRAHLVVSTAHKAKGREWNAVEVADDFREPRRGEDGSPGPVPRADAMLAYVTVTRAMEVLDHGGLSWIHDRAKRPRAGRHGHRRVPGPLDPAHPDWRDPYRS